jgi:hypothetical protein
MTELRGCVFLGSLQKKKNRQEPVFSCVHERFRPAQPGLRWSIFFCVHLREFAAGLVFFLCELCTSAMICPVFHS